MKHRRLEPFVFYSNDNPRLTLIYFRARSNFATYAFIWENMTMIDLLKSMHTVTWNLVKVN